MWVWNYRPHVEYDDPVLRLYSSWQKYVVSTVRSISFLPTGELYRSCFWPWGNWTPSKARLPTVPMSLTTANHRFRPSKSGLTWWMPIIRWLRTACLTPLAFDKRGILVTGSNMSVNQHFSARWASMCCWPNPSPPAWPGSMRLFRFNCSPA